jgi:hypothetical protein
MVDVLVSSWCGRALGVVAPAAAAANFLLSVMVQEEEHLRSVSDFVAAEVASLGCEATSGLATDCLF